MTMPVINALNAIIYLIRFVFGPTGKEYGVNPAAKFQLLLKLRRNAHHRDCASLFLEHIILAHAVLECPKSEEGVVGEFGCYKGLSTASLSLVCSLAKRKLVIFDSFQGLPQPKEEVTSIVTGKKIAYNKGDYSSNLNEVQQNVRSYGNINVCDFVTGYFEETLPAMPPTQKFVLIFEDADLPSSVLTVLKYAWPRLRVDGYFFSHEARDFEVVALFFDKAWWSQNLGALPPGLIGSGIGLPLSKIGSYLAFTTKRTTKLPLAQ